MKNKQNKTEKIYSTDFMFFLEHQIILIMTNNRRHYTFSSRLNGELFKEIDGHTPLNEQEIREQCKKIHLTLI